MCTLVDYSFHRLPLHHLGGNWKEFMGMEISTQLLSDDTYTHQPTAENLPRTVELVCVNFTG